MLYFRSNIEGQGLLGQKCNIYNSPQLEFALTTSQLTADHFTTELLF